VRFSMASGGPNNEPIVRQSEGDELDKLSDLILSKLQSDIAPYLNETSHPSRLLGCRLIYLKTK
jgi:hypothetical protein